MAYPTNAAEGAELVVKIKRAWADWLHEPQAPWGNRLSDELFLEFVRGEFFGLEAILQHAGARRIRLHDP